MEATHSASRQPPQIPPLKLPKLVRSDPVFFEIKDSESTSHTSSSSGHKRRVITVHMPPNIGSMTKEKQLEMAAIEFLLGSSAQGWHCMLFALSPLMPAKSLFSAILKELQDKETAENDLFKLLFFSTEWLSANKGTRAAILAKNEIDAIISTCSRFENPHLAKYEERLTSAQDAKPEASRKLSFPQGSKKEASDWTERSIAHDLHSFQQFLYQSLQVHTVEADPGNTTPHAFRVFLEHQGRLIQYIIAQTSNADQIIRFIKIASLSFKLRDLQTVYCIVEALTSNQVLQLKASWKEVRKSEKYTKKWRQYNELFTAQNLQASIARFIKEQKSYLPPVGYHIARTMEIVKQASEPIDFADGMKRLKNIEQELASLLACKEAWDKEIVGELQTDVIQAILATPRSETGLMRLSFEKLQRIGFDSLTHESIATMSSVDRLEIKKKLRKFLLPERIVDDRAREASNALKRIEEFQNPIRDRLFIEQLFSNSDSIWDAMILYNESIIKSTSLFSLLEQHATKAPEALPQVLCFCWKWLEGNRKSALFDDVEIYIKAITKLSSPGNEDQVKKICKQIDKWLHSAPVLQIATAPVHTTRYQFKEILENSTKYATDEELIREIATDLSMHQAALYCNLDKHEVLVSKWQKQPAGCRAIGAHFNTLSSYVSHVATTFERLLFFIDITNHCLTLRDYQSGLSLFTGLKRQVIHFSKLLNDSPQHAAIFARCEHLFSLHNNFANLRHETVESHDPCIPYLGLLLADLEYLDHQPQILELETGPVYNIAKLQQIKTTVDAYFQYKLSWNKIVSTPYAPATDLLSSVLPAFQSENNV